MATTTISKLPSLVRHTFKAAEKNGDLTFYETQVSILQCNGLPFQVRFSPALANKTKSNRQRDPKGEPVDPFSDISKGLFIADLPGHNLILNRFPIIPNHFILATKDFREQTHLLEEDDLGAAYECLKAYHENGEELFGFFNSGEHSGASQPHRHIQFLPVDSMRSGIEACKSWEVLADSLVKTPRPNLPFGYFSSALPQHPTPRLLHDIYTTLHNSACRIAQGSNMSLPSTRGSRISYNLGLTHRVVVLCPRASEGIKIKSSNGEDVGPMALNGTILGGTLLVKSDAEWQDLRNDESKLKHILSAIGYPPSKIEHYEKI